MKLRVLPRRDVKPVGSHDPEYVAFYARCPGCRRWVSVQKANVDWWGEFQNADCVFCFNHKYTHQLTVPSKVCSFHSIVGIRHPKP